ncbi:2TM domain-containing protein [Ascidiimonas aurantiaca]|uniref:2TM domain-containing protein n=1 Tax=Ascidiimonas aurantiaca TaxID=1685432 RepID=UPI0030EDC826
MKKLVNTLVTGMMIGLLLTILFNVYEIANGGVFKLDTRFFQDFFYNVLFSTVITFINVYYFDYINHKVNWVKYRKYRLLIGASGSITLTMMGIFFTRMIIEIVFEGESWDEFISGERFSFYINSLLITIFISALFHVIYLYKEIQKNKIREQKIIAGTASAQFDALKNQLDPHFLFNSLNVLTALIEEDPDAAQKFTTSLSKVYRYVLEQKNKELVTVQEELDFARLYVGLLKMRFEDSIVFEIPEKVNNPEAKVVPLSLQLLLENAVKHNMVTPSSPLLLTILEENGNLVVRNKLQPKQVLNKSTGVGLINIQQRYGILSDRKVEIEKTNNTFSVKLPLLTKQKSSMETQKTYIEDKRYERARERVEAIKSFYGNLTSYIIVIPLLAYLNYLTSDFPWAIFPAVGWGLGVIAHGMEAFGYNPFLGKNWEQKKIKEYMEKDKS